jgi:hypothetical protein
MPGMRLFLAALTLGLAAAVAAGAQAATVPPTLLVIQVKSVTTGADSTDKAPKGPSKGDRLVQRSRLLNVAKQFGKPAGAVVGHDLGLIVLASAKAGRVTGTATFPGGTIRFRGTVRVTDSGPGSYEVTGGTGRYAKARGTLFVGAGDAPLNTYHLRLPAQPDAGTTV